jgi:frataxin-like iron-binding protein CyaY
MSASVTHALPCNKVEEVGKKLEALYGPQDVPHCYEGHFFLIKQNNKSQMIVDVQYAVKQIVMDIKTGKKHLMVINS